MRVLVTGAAGFIGFHVCKRLLEEKHEVVGFDNINEYYDIRLKNDRLSKLKDFDLFTFIKGDLEDHNVLKNTWTKFDPSHVIHLAAQAGVRYSIEEPMKYIHSNIVGFQNIIELVRKSKLTNFLYASSSSVYGGNRETPYNESLDINSPVSLYAATKVSNEIVARTYGNLFNIPNIGLRFFTVYGSFYRPDMALYRFADRISRDQPIPVYNNGNLTRDFTYIDDIVNGVISALNNPKKNQVYNLGRGKPEKLMDMIVLLENCFGKKANYEFLPMQAGDVFETHADITKAAQELNYRPMIDISVGIPLFFEWFKKYI